MWGRKRRALLAAERRAELEALRADIAADISAQLRTSLSLALVDGEGHPNTADLNTMVRNLPLATLTLKTLGYELARALAAALPVRERTEARTIGLRSKASTQADMESDWVAHWCAELRIPVLFHRKFWEFAFLLQALFEHDLLRADARGLGFGCGGEPIASYLAGRGVPVTITDLAPEDARAAGWAATGQHAASLDQAYRSELVDRPAFDRLVGFEIADMTAIPDRLAGYDFCWSLCAFEHLGSIERGLRFVSESLRTLRPGGLAVHTTELNILPEGPTIDDWPTVLFQRRHLETLAAGLRDQGHWVAELDFDTGDKPLDRFIDMPPWGHDLPPAMDAWHRHGAHLKVSVDGFPCTSFGLVIRKAG